MLTDETFARSFRALSHPRRALVFRMLVHQPEVGDTLEGLIAVTGFSPSSLVHHLREMERCGLLTRKRKGTYVAYRLTPGPLTAALAAAMRMSERGRSGVSRAA